MLPVITTVLILGLPPSCVRSTEVFRPIAEAVGGSRGTLIEPAPAAPGLWQRVGSASAARIEGEDVKGHDPLDQSRANEIRGESRESERRLRKFSELVLLPLGACLLLIMMLRRAIW